MISVCVLYESHFSVETFQIGGLRLVPTSYCVVPLDKKLHFLHCLTAPRCMNGYQAKNAVGNPAVVWWSI